MLAYESPLERAETTRDGIELEVGGSRADAAAGRARRQQRRADAPCPGARGSTAGTGQACREAYYCKGNYYGLAGRSPFSRLIYPVPERAGLGVHVTVDLAGRCRFGPDTEWVDGDRLSRSTRRGPSVLRRGPQILARTCRTARWCRTMPASGRSSAPAGSPAADFIVCGPAEHGVPGLVKLFGIESPGLTASWPIAVRGGAQIGTAGARGRDGMTLRDRSRSRAPRAARAGTPFPSGRRRDRRRFAPT